MDAQLFSSYNQQLFVSILNMINKYKLLASSISPVFNYHNFVYMTFKHHVEQFPSVFKPIKWKIESMVSRFEWALDFVKQHICVLEKNLEVAKKTLECIKCCIDKLKNCTRSYIEDLRKKIGCYIQSVIIEFVVYTRSSGVDGVNNLSVSLEERKDELISSLLSKVNWLKGSQPDTGWLDSIISELKRISGSASQDKCKISRIKNHVQCSGSIKSEMDTFKFYINKYVKELTDTVYQIAMLLGSAYLKNLNKIIKEMSSFACFAQRKIESFKSSVILAIRLTCIGMSCDVRRVYVGIECVEPSFCSIKNSLEPIICSLVHQKCLAQNIIGCVQGPWSNVKSRIEIMEGIKCELEEIESSINMVNFFKYSNKAIIRNKIDLTKRLLGIGKNISNDGLVKSGLHGQGVGNHDKQEYGGVLTVLSNMAIVESKLVSSYLYEISKSVKETLETLQSAEKCLCVFYYECDYDKEKKRCRRNFSWRISSRINISNLHKKFHTNHVNEEGNNICLCLIIKYLLVPNLLNCFRCFYDINFGLISTYARKFDGYDRPNINIMRISKLTFFILGIIEKVVVSMEKRYLKSCRNKDCFCKQSKENSVESKALLIQKGLALLLGKTCSETVFIFYLIYYVSLLIDPDYLCKLLRCFCRCTDDPYYEYFVSIILFICNLIENIFGSDSKMLDNSIQYSLNMVADYYSMGIDPHRVDISSPSAGDEKITYGTVNINQAFSGIVITDNTLILTLGYSSTDAKKFIGNAMSELSGTIKQVISTVTIRGPKFNLFYESFSTLSFKLINSGMVNLETKSYIRKTNLFLSNQYILRVRNKTSKLEKLCSSKEQSPVCDISCKSKILCITLNLAREKYNLISSKMINYSILHFLNDQSPDIYRIAGDINRNTINITEIIIKTSKNSRISDATQKILIPDRDEETVTNNHYSYNDAYRINTSRAHGSLKYIIIKIVLILIIVVMTIFISETLELISHKPSIICQIINTSLFAMSSMEGKLDLSL